MSANPTISGTPNTAPQSPALHWTDSGVPVSSGFGDVYFSADGGLAETRHVFLDGCDMPRLWAGRSHITVGETGFGTGLNLLALWDRWRQTASPQARLSYLTVERHPLAVEHAARALAQFPELAPLARQLFAVWPPAHAGFHTVILDGGRLRLTLLVGDAATQLAQAQAQVDAWFLDGFAPSANPDMWSPALFAQLARLSAPGARLASFTVAGMVRRGLQAAGFSIEKRPGWGRKREALAGQFTGVAADAPERAPWLSPPPPAPDGPVLVVGGGIAGCAVAGALAARGRAVMLVERRDQLAAEASALPVGLVMPRPSAGADGEAQFLAACFNHAARWLPTQPDGWQPTGALRLAGAEADQARLQQWIDGTLHPPGWMQPVDAAEASSLAGIALAHGGVWLPTAGLARAADLCRAVTTGVARITLSNPATGLSRQADGWCLHTKLGDFTAAAVVLASANECHLFAQAALLPVTPMRGQTSLFAPTAASAKLRVPLVFGHYLTPALDGLHHAGATFDPVPPTGALAIRAEDHTRILNGLAQTLPGLLPYIAENALGGHVGLRAVTPDRLPLAGMLPDLADWRLRYARLAVGERTNRLPQPSYWPGLAVHLALGARGLTTAWLTADLIAAQLCGEPWPLPRLAAEAVHPGRFIIRSLKRPPRAG